jgi:hypothetical protein
MSVKIISFTPNDKLSKTGWAASFVYDCKCGSTHHTQAHGLWPDGNTSVSDAYVTCPTTGENSTVELKRPEA